MSIKEKFLEFHRKNPHVYVMFRDLALKVKATGRYKRFGIRTIAEHVRWHFEFNTDRVDRFKMSNNHNACYARLLMENEPELAGFFQTNRLRS